MHLTSSPDLRRKSDQEISRFPDPSCIAYDDFFRLKDQEIIERNIDTDLKPSQAIAEEFLIPGIHLMRFRYKDPGNGKVVFKAVEPYLSMVFSIKTNLIYRNEADERFAEISHNEHQLVFISSQQTDLSWQAAQDSEIVIINLTLEYFKRFLSTQHPLYKTFGLQFEQKISAALAGRKLNITNKMLSILYEIAQCAYTADYKRLFVKSKVIELLMLQLNQVEHGAVSAETTRPNNLHTGKMHRAREILVADLSRSVTLPELAEQVDTNECYLKKHFKQVFGTTVYGYLLKERMERSKELLLAGEKKVADVAKASGYRHTSHFSAAFKKYFGYLPNRIRVSASNHTL